MTALSHHQLAKGRDRFLQDHPVVKARIDALTTGHADALGVTLEALRETETMRELLAIAQQKRVDSTEFFWGYIADTPGELAAMLEQREQNLRKIIG